MTVLHQASQELMIRQRHSLRRSGLNAAGGAVAAWVILMTLCFILPFLLIGSTAWAGAGFVSFFTRRSSNPDVAFIVFLILLIPVMILLFSFLETVRYWFAKKKSDEEWTCQVGAMPGPLGVLPMTPSAAVIHSTGTVHGNSSGLWVFKEFLLAPAHLTVDAIRHLTVKTPQVESESDRLGVLIDRLYQASGWAATSEFKEFADLIPVLVILEIAWVKMRHGVCEIRIAHHLYSELHDLAEARQIAMNQPASVLKIRLMDDPDSPKGFRVEIPK